MLDIGWHAWASAQRRCRAAAIVATHDNEVLSERAAELGARLREALRTRPHPADALFPPGSCQPASFRRRKMWSRMRARLVNRVAIDAHE